LVPALEEIETPSDRMKALGTAKTPQEVDQLSNEVLVSYNAMSEEDRRRQFEEVCMLIVTDRVTNGPETNYPNYLELHRQYPTNEINTFDDVFNIRLSRQARGPPMHMKGITVALAKGIFAIEVNRLGSGQCLLPSKFLVV
jgi:hypothetical protein